MPDQNILEEALGAVYGPRQAAYGHPRDNFRRIADLWNGWMRAHDSAFEFKPEDTADLLLLLKLARLIETPDHRDSHVDIAGYAAARARSIGVDE